MLIISGLGNIGREYEKTVHNAGFTAIDNLADKLNVRFDKKGCSALYTVTYINGEKTVLAKPQTYMNLSGNSVVKAANFYKILPQNIVVIHDDMDLPVGKLKVKTGGGAGGHNGLKSIDAAITPEYHRIRIGVGHPAEKGEAVVNHVLSRFSKTDAELVNDTIAFVADTIDILLKDGMAAYSNKIGILRKGK